MELRQLRYFVAVAEEGNISRAAQKIFLTQPALSRQIKALEEEIGEPLLDRRSQSIALTPAGEVLWLEARGLLAQAEAVLAKVRANGREIRLRVGYAPSLTAGLLASAVESFTQTHPHARVELFDLSTTEMVDGIKAGTLDVMLTVQQACGKAGIDWTPLCESRWTLAASRKHRLAAKARVTAAHIAAEPLLIYLKAEYPDYYDFVGGWFRRCRQTPRIAGEFDGSASLIAAVEAGLGVALMSDRSVSSPRIKLLDLVDGPDPLVIAAGWRSGRKLGKPIAVFLDELRAAATP